ncbi:MAG: hypothetical protein ACFCU6_00925, partial [Balneolaceae bacterium]
GFTQRAQCSRKERHDFILTSQDSIRSGCCAQLFSIAFSTFPILTPAIRNIYNGCEPSIYSVGKSDRDSWFFEVA